MIQLIPPLNCCPFPYTQVILGILAQVNVLVNTQNYSQKGENYHNSWPF